MTTTNEHEDVRVLLGAYALGAVSPLEERRVERHLPSCEDCAREARLLSETASELALLSGDEELPDGFVDRIVDDLPGKARRRNPVLRMAAAVAAAAIVAVAAVGSLYLRERQRSDELLELVASAERTVRLEPHEGFSGDGVLYVAGEEILLALRDVPDPGEARSYQLWALGGTEGPRSVGVFHAAGRVHRILRWDGGGERFAVTIEPRGGSAQPTTSPILVGA